MYCVTQNCPFSVVKEIKKLSSVKKTLVCTIYPENHTKVTANPTGRGRKIKQEAKTRSREGSISFDLAEHYYYNKTKLSSPPIQICGEQLTVPIKLLYVKKRTQVDELILKLSSFTFFTGPLWTSLGFAALASSNNAPVQSVQLPNLYLKCPWRDKGPVFCDSEMVQTAKSESTVEPSICQVV